MFKLNCQQCLLVSSIRIFQAELWSALLKSHHLDRADLDSPRAMSMVLYVNGRPSEVLPVSVTVLREYYAYLKTHTGVIPLKLPHAAVYPSSSDLMSRRLGLAVLSPDLAHGLRATIDTHREIFSIDPRGTLAYLELSSEIATLLTAPGTFACAPMAMERVGQIVQELQTTTQVLSDVFAQRNDPGVVDPFAPNCKRLSSTFLPAPTLNGILIAFNALKAANEEILERCSCCRINLACTTSGEAVEEPVEIFL